MVPRNTRTLIIKSAFPAGVSHAGVADIIGRSLSGQIDSIQVCPGGIIRVSFLDPQSKSPMRRPAPLLLMTFVVKFYVLLPLPMF